MSQSAAGYSCIINSLWDKARTALRVSEQLGPARFLFREICMHKHEITRDAGWLIKRGQRLREFVNFKGKLDNDEVRNLELPRLCRG